MKSYDIKFTGSHGVNLSGRMDEPDNGKIRSAVLFAHCFTCSKNLNSVGHISRDLTDRGICVFRFDFTGLGESEGEFSESTLSTDIEDFVAAASVMEKEGKAPAILMGHSLGGAAAIQAAHKIRSAKAVAVMGTPSNPEHVIRHMSLKIDEIEEHGEATVQLAGRPFKIKKSFIEDLRGQVMDQNIKNLDKALLIFHSPTDNIVGIENASHIYQMARHPKSFISLDNADHLLSKDEDAAYVGQVTAAWAQRYFA